MNRVKLRMSGPRAYATVLATSMIVLLTFSTPRNAEAVVYRQLPNAHIVDFVEAEHEEAVRIQLEEMRGGHSEDDQSFQKLLILMGLFGFLLIVSVTVAATVD